MLESTYWRSFEKVRIQARSGGGTSDFLVKDSETRQVLAAAKDQAGHRDYTARRMPSSRLIGLCDVWSQMLIDLFRPDGGPVDFDRFLNLAKEPPRVTKDRLNGVACIRVKMSIQDANGGEIGYVLWHDATRNYLVRKVEMTYSKDSNSHFEAENTEFIEAVPEFSCPPVACAGHARVNGTVNVRRH